jgi:hypothetical protein
MQTDIHKISEKEKKIAASGAHAELLPGKGCYYVVWRQRIVEEKKSMIG